MIWKQWYENKDNRFDKSYTLEKNNSLLNSVIDSFKISNAIILRTAVCLKLNFEIAFEESALNW